MVLILKYLSKYKWKAFLAPFFKLLEALIDLFVPYLIGLLIDKGIKGNDVNLIIIYFISLVSLALIGLLFAIVGQYFAAKCATNVSHDLRYDLYKHIESLSFKQIDSIGRVNMINLLTNDINQVQNGVNLVLRLILRSPFVVFGSAIFATILAPNISYIFWVSIAILFIISFAIMIIVIPIYAKSQAKLDDILTISKDNLAGARVVRAFNIEDDEINIIEKETINLQKYQRRGSFVSSLLNPLTFVVINIFIVLLIYVGAIKVNDGLLTQGTVVSLYNYMGQILIELIKFTNLVILINKSIVCSRRIKKILDIKNNEVLDEKKLLNKPFITFEHVNFGYHQDKLNLKNINFSINKGDFLGIIGGTASGKTTLANILLKSYDINNGDIYLNGYNINSLSSKEIYSLISLADQKNPLFRGTVKDNLSISNPNIDDEELIKALKVAQCDNFILNKEHPLDIIVEQNGRNFSGGQKQRLSIARTIASKKEVLIFDDSTSSLDYLTDANFRKALKSLDYQPTIIIISQRASTIIDADKILVLDKGEQIAFDTHSNLLKNCPVYQDIYYSQFEKEDNK